MVDDPSVEDGGGFEFASGMDIFSEPGVVKASLAMVPVTLEAAVGTLNAIPSAMVDVTTATNTLAYIAVGAKILDSNDGGINNGTTWDLFHTNTNGSNLDLHIFGGRLWYAAPAFLGYAPVDNASLADDSFAALESDLEYHPMLQQAGTLKVGNGRYVGSIDESFSFTAQAMKMPVGYRAKALADFLNQLLIGTRFGAKLGDIATLDATVFGWRGSVLASGSALPDNVYPLKLRGMNAIVYDGQACYGFPDKKGVVYVFDGARFVRFRKISAISAAAVDMQVKQNSVSPHLDTVLFSGNCSSLPGVYQMRDGALCQAFVPSTTTPGSSHNLDIGLVKSAFGGRVFCGYYNNALGTYHLDVTSSGGARQAGAVLRTLWHQAGTGRMKRWAGILLNLKPMAANTAVTVAYRTARDAAFVDLPHTVTAANQHRPVMFSARPRSREIQFRFTYTVSGQASPELVSYSPLFDTLISAR